MDDNHFNLDRKSFLSNELSESEKSEYLRAEKEGPFKKAIEIEPEPESKQVSNFAQSRSGS